jgi:hypothetical protein
MIETKQITRISSWTKLVINKARTTDKVAIKMSCCWILIFPTNKIDELVEVCVGYEVLLLKVINDALTS